MWALGFGHLLRQTDASRARQHFHSCQATLAAAVQLASVCKDWRAAAVQAFAALPDATMQPRSSLAPGYLSPLLADLARGRHIALHSPLLAALTVPAFLQRARLASLITMGLMPGADFEDALAGNTSLRRLSYWDIDEPHCSWYGCRLPPGLHSLVMHLRGNGASREAAALLQRVHCLLSLTDLTLCLSIWELELPAPSLLQLGHLKQLIVCIEYHVGCVFVDLSALQAAARQGVRVAIRVTMDLSSYEPAAMFGDTRPLWAGLAQVALLDQLHLELQLNAPAGTCLTAAERRALASVHCKQLVLHDVSGWLPFSQALVQSASFDSLICQYGVAGGSFAEPHWSQLTRAGIHVLGHVFGVTGCSGTLPVTSKP